LDLTSIWKNAKY